MIAGLYPPTVQKMTNPAQGTPAGWYPDPGHPGHVRYYDGRYWTQHLQPAATVPRDKLVGPVVGGFIAASGLGVIAGSFMDWATALGGAIGKSGIDGGDGWVTVILGIVLGAVGLLVLARKGEVGYAVAAILAATLSIAVAIYELHDLPDGLGVGAGLPLIIVAAVVGLLSSVVGIVTRNVP